MLLVHADIQAAAQYAAEGHLHIRERRPKLYHKVWQQPPSDGRRVRHAHPGIMASAYSTAVTVPATLDLEKMVLRK